jgi:membrane protein implicated in regulation of membrane protease activity
VGGYVIAITPSILWLSFGIFLIILEFSQLPGIGFLFLGFGAITTAIIANYLQAENILIQFAYFGILSITWFALLWYPMKKFIYQNDNIHPRESFDIVGSRVTVIKNDIKAGSLGQVLWSGTVMNARLVGTINNDIAKVDDTLIVMEVKGNTLFCQKTEGQS